MLSRLLLFAIPAACSLAQSVRIYSEFERIDPFGNVVAADKAELPREILSPALARNAWASFQVAVTFPAGKMPTLFIVQNPEHSAGLKLYKAVFEQHGDHWVPDVLQPVKLDENGRVTDLGLQVPGQTTLVYWMDLWIAKEAPVRRTRLEVQLNNGDYWVIAPMELRMQTLVAPQPGGPWEPLAPVESPSADSARQVLRSYVCAGAANGPEGPLTIRRMIRRNARQDLAIARALEPALGKAGVVSGALGQVQTVKDKFCANGAFDPQLGAEWYLRVRDFLYRSSVTSLQ